MNNTRTYLIAVVGAALTIGLTGCGGSSGGGSGGSGGGGTGGSGSLSASMTILGGFFLSSKEAPVAAGSTVDLQLTDHNGNLHAVGTVYSPDSLTSTSVGSCTVIRAGSNLLSGKYTSASAKYINPDENFSATIPLTSSGAVAKDTVIPGDGEIILPISTIGNDSFPNGVTVTLSSGGPDNSVQNNTLAFKATIPALGKPNANAGQMTFTDSGTVSPQANMTLAFSSSDGLSGVQIAPVNNINSSSPVVLAGYANGSGTVLTNAAVSYDLED